MLMETPEGMIEVARALNCSVAYVPMDKDETIQKSPFFRFVYLLICRGKPDGLKHYRDDINTPVPDVMETKILQKLREG